MLPSTSITPVSRRRDAVADGPRHGQIMEELKIVDVAVDMVVF
jgi:hypothetical protein